MRVRADPIREVQRDRRVAIGVDQGESGVVRRPGRSGEPAPQERSRCAAGERQEHLLASRISQGIEPDLRPVAVEPQTSQEICRRDHGGAIRGEILKRPGADLTQPDVKLSVPVGDERDKPAIGRDVRLLLAAAPISEPSECRVGERVAGDLDGYSASGLPRRHSRGEREQRHPRQTFQPGVRRSGACPGTSVWSTSSIASISIRASPISLRRCFESFFRQRIRSRRIGAGVAAGRADQSGSRSRIFAIAVRDRLAGITPRARSPSRTARSQMPRYPCACRLVVPAPARGSCRRRSR